MLAKTLVWILTAKFVQTQLNGDFWWLNSQLGKHYNNGRPSLPKFEVLSEYDNDESARIVFRDTNLITNSHSETKFNIGKIEEQKTEANIVNEDRVVWPDEVNKFMYSNVAVFNNILKNTSEITTEKYKKDLTINSHKNDLIFNVSTELIAKNKPKNLTEVTKNIDPGNVILFNDDRVLTNIETKPTVSGFGNKGKQKTDAITVDNHRVVWPNDVNKVIHSNVVYNSIQTNTSKIITEDIATNDKNDEFFINIDKNSNSIFNDVVNVSTFLTNTPKNYTTEIKNDSSMSTILFDDDRVIINSKTKPTVSGFGNKGKQKTEANTVDNHRVVWPDDVNKVIYSNVTYNNIQKNTPKIIRKNNATNDEKDEFVINIDTNSNSIFNHVVNMNTELTNTAKNYTTENKNDSSKSAILFDDTRIGIHKTKESHSENICTYMKKNECYENKGLVHGPQFKNNLATTQKDTQLFCCILPLPMVENKDESSNVFFPDAVEKYKRIKRSDQNKDDTVSSALKQRNILLQRKLSTQFLKFKPSSTAQSKAVTPDDEYGDPYWNIKNSNFRNTDKQSNKQTNIKYDYGHEDYIEDYVVELPKPGLVGIYSDHAIEPPNWSFSNEDFSYDDADDYAVDTDTSFGYSTIDPRQGTNPRRNRNPVKSTKTSDEVAYDAESQTIHFESNPDFQVLQGFKLLNLMRSNSKIQVSKPGRKSTTTESISDSERNESEETTPVETSESFFDEFSEDDQKTGCGKAIKVMRDEGDAQISDARNGSHPWLALLVLTKRRQTVLCYATLVHPRAAITAADCVDGMSPGEITLIAGLWNLNERSGAKSRIVSVSVHPRYNPGDIANNLALLRWMRPLKLGVNLQPACLAEPRVGDDCKFFGWGGFDGFRPKSRWQRASIRACSARVNKRGGKPPSTAFCASVHSRGTVTGTGGSLICDKGHHTAVGVIVSRDNAYVLLRIRGWTLRAINKLGAD